MTRRKLGPWTPWLGAVALALCAVGARGGTPIGPSPARFTARTPDEMLNLALARAGAGGDGALAGLAIAHAMAERASADRAHAGLLALGRSEGDIADQARWVAAELDPNPASPPAGLLRGFSILGPFQDTGGGLARREGPEESGETWGDPNASYAWGAYEVRWRKVPEAVISARGIPLDLMIHPRKESCSYLATRISVKKRAPVVFSVAATGAVRLIWDGVDVTSSEETHEGLVFDRLAAKVESAAGDHLLALKVCSGAIDDDGRVRVRASDGAGHPVDLESSADATWKGPSDKPSATVMSTELGRAVDVGAHPSLSKALVASIVRTLGKADDLRSPRASGLIDKVANGPQTTPDALAMVGWISPFGAPRSGWLNLAIERATAAGDLATASFAQRRMVVSRLSAKWGDWAMASLGSEPLASDVDSEARLIRGMVQGSLGLDSLRRLALSNLLETANREGSRASAALWQEVATLSSKLDPALHARAKNQLTRLLPEARDAAWVQSMSAVSRAAVKTASEEAIAAGALTSDSELLDVADTLVSAGLHDEAKKLYQTSTSLCPNRAGAWYGFAEALYEKSDRGEGARALQRARALDPAEVRYRAEATFRDEDKKVVAGERDRAMPTTDRDHAADAVYVVEPRVFLARKEAHPAEKGEVFDRQLHWTRVVTFHADRRVSQLIQYAREIVIEPRTQEELYEPLPAEGDETEILRARVHRASGGIAFAEEQKSEGGRPTVRWPDLKTGDVVEVVLRTWTSRPVGGRGNHPFYFIDYAGSVATHPLLYNEVVVDSPESRPLAVDILHGKANRMTDEVKNHRRVLRIVWENPANIPDEPLAPKSSEVLPTIIGSTFTSWKDFRDWYQAAVAGFTEPDEQVRKLAADLTKGKTRREDKVKAIYEYVADDIRYVNYVSGEWWLPNRPQQLLARRQGDCDDKAILLITLLKAVGIEATEVLLQTRLTAQPSLLQSTKAAVPLFNHGIAYLPGEGGAPGQWLDAVVPESRIGPLPAMDARALAFYVSEGPPEMVKTPLGKPEEHGVEGTWKIQLSANGGGNLDARERHAGDHAYALRTNLREKDARAQWVEQNLLSGWFPTVEVKKEVDFSGDLPGGLADVHYQAHSDGLARREGNELVVPLAPASTMTSQLAPLVRRTLPVVLPPYSAPSHQTRTLHILPPPGYRPGELPPGGEVNGGEFGQAKLEVKKEGARGVLVKRSVVFDMSTIPVDKYDAWRGWLQRVDALLHRSVRFVPAKPVATAGGTR